MNTLFNYTHWHWIVSGFVLFALTLMTVVPVGVFAQEATSTVPTSEDVATEVTEVADEFIEPTDAAETITEEDASSAATTLPEESAEEGTDEESTAASSSDQGAGVDEDSLQTESSTTTVVDETVNGSTTDQLTTATTTPLAATTTDTTSPSTTDSIASPDSTTASTTISTSTNTAAASTTPQSEVSAVTSGNTTVGTTTTTVSPTAPASTSATTTPDATVSSPSSTTTPPKASTTIKTGGSVASANVLNVVNSTLVNATGAVVFVDAKDDVNETIDLRSQLSDPATGTCSLLGCAANTTNVQLDNDAEIDNALVVTADTGNNLIVDAATGEITTGNAYANANVINVANANIIDSQYLLLTLNAFGNYNGDLILPALAPFLSNAATTPALSLDNTAIILNDIITTAISGGNATDAAKSTITTGDATTGVSLYNNINTNLANDNVKVLFRVHGDWNGTVFGLPKHVQWYATPHGYLLDINGTTTPATRNGVTSVTATNTAVINNRINVAATTGNNEIRNADNALISTGNAYAGANVVNIANANIVGQNWMMAIVNVFGDFNGNVSFGRPDIWVGGAASVPKHVEKDSRITYTYTIKNNGDAPASDVVITDDVSPLVAVHAVQNNGVASGNTIVWKLDELAPGESTTLSYEARVTTATRDAKISNTITSTLTEPDENYANNTEVLSFYTSKPRSSTKKESEFGFGGTIDDGVDAGTGPHSTTSTEAAAAVTALQMNRTPFVSTVSDLEKETTQTIQIFNNTNKPVHNALFIDQLYDINSQLIHEERVELGSVLPYEEITFSYTMSFNHAAAPPLETYSFDSIFFDGSERNVLTRNGYINHIAAKTAAPTSDFTFSTTPHITTGDSSFARVLGATTSTSSALVTIPVEPKSESTKSLFPTANAASELTGAATTLPISLTDLVFPTILVILFLYYLYLRHSNRFIAAGVHRG